MSTQCFFIAPRLCSLFLFLFAAEEKKEEKTEKMDTTPPADEKKGTRAFVVLFVCFVKSLTW